MAKLMSAKEVSEEMSIHPKTLLKWVRNSNDFPVSRLSKRCLRFDPIAVSLWIKGRSK
jgi:hypothetical protein